MLNVRQQIGGLGNLMFKEAFLLGKLLDGEIPDVYVQNSKYWAKHAETIKSIFSLGIGAVDRVALHLRRGDYVLTDFHTNLADTTYYQEAVKNFPGENFLVFCKDNQGRDTDDRAWARTFLDSLDITWEFAPLETSETQDLNLMASCKSVIMANSSFSWWGAFLGNHQTVICPKNWFTDGVQRTELLDDWIQL